MSTLDAPDNRRKKGGRQVARPNRPWTQKELASRHAYNAAGVMLTRADMKELGSTDNNSDDGEYDAKRDAALSYDVAIAEMRRRKEWRDKLTAAKRVEFIGNCMMIQGDCLEVMPQIGKVDAILTDPPYGLGKKMSGGTWATKALHYQDMHEWDLEAKQEWIDEIIALQAPTIIWGGNYFNVPASRCWLSWCKPDFPTMADMELAWTNFDKPEKRFPMSRVPDGAKQHPTQKPIELMTWCITHLPETTKTILDPFAGSGTTGVACVKTGRKFIGVEIDPDYFDIACKRIREAYAQPDLLIDAPKAAPEVQEAFEL